MASEETEFTSFIGYPPRYVGGIALGYANGNDTVELYEKFEYGGVFDVYGDIVLDGTGQPWEYRTGWAYRANCTEPSEDGNSTFGAGNQYFSEANALGGVPRMKMR